MTGSDPQAPVDSSPTVEVGSEKGADDYRLDLNARARWVATRACRSRAAYAVGHGYEEVHYVLRDLAVILGPTDARTDGDGKLVLEAVQVSRVADACDWLAVHARDDDLADDAALVAYALREAVDVDVAAEEDVEADEEQQVLPDGGHCSVGAECDLCGEGAVDCLPVTNDETRETRDANLCKEHRDKVMAYTRGEEVNWDV
jgi:hypothetical protein